jgi:hypothetical protein
MIVVGIAGKKRSGKDTVAQMLVDLAEHKGIKAVRRAFADALKEECAKLLVQEFDNFYKGYYSPEMERIELERILKEMNQDETKEQYRLLLQWWGTEFKRKMISDSYWTDKMEKWIAESTQDMVIIPDVRFPNEVQMIKRLHGVIINVKRPDQIALDGHASETALDTFHDWDYTIINDRSLACLRLLITRLGIV